MLAVAAEQGVDAFGDGERVLSYPSLVRLLPGEGALEIDKRRERRLRPSVVVKLLAALQGKPPWSRPEAFLESLRNVYDLVVRSQGEQAGAVVRLIDICRPSPCAVGSVRRPGCPRASGNSSTRATRLVLVPPEN